MPRKNQPESIGLSATLTIPELEQSKAAVLNTFASQHSRRSYECAIENFTRKLLRKNSNPSHLSTRVSTGEKLQSCSAASDKTAKQNESDDHFRLANHTLGMCRERTRQ
jgi:hypothetical protein